MTVSAKLLRIPQNDRPSASIAALGEPILAARPRLFEAKKAKKTVKKIALPTMEGFQFEKTKNVLYLEASGNYTMLHFVDGRQTLVCKTLREVETMLPEADFVRIHRSHTIQLRHLQKYVRGKGGCVVLAGGAALAVSSGQKEFFLEAVKRFFGHVS